MWSWSVAVVSIGAVRLAAALEKNESLTELRDTIHYLGDKREPKEAIHAALKRNTRTLELRGLFTEPKDKSHIAAIAAIAVGSGSDHAQVAVPIENSVDKPKDDAAIAAGIARMDISDVPPVLTAEERQKQAQHLRTPMRGGGSSPRSQARAAWISACADPAVGCTPDELGACVARAGFDKFRHVTPLSAGAKVSGFLASLLGDDDEEDVVLAATGGRKASDDAE